MKYRVKIGCAAVRHGAVVARNGAEFEIDPEDPEDVRWLQTQAHVVEAVEEPKPKRKTRPKAQPYEDRSMRSSRDGGTSDR